MYKRRDYIDLEDNGHIDHLYCIPEATRQGVSLALYNAVEEIAEERTMECLKTEASEAAKRFFARRGFELIKRRKLMLGKVEIHNFAMRKLLH